MTKGYMCPNCGRIMGGDEEPEPLYECGSCGTVFIRSNSSDGNSHRCPFCYKFASKLSDLGCPDCESEMEETDVGQDENGEWQEATEEAS